MDKLDEHEEKFKEMDGASGERIDLLERRLALMKTKMAQNGFDIGSPAEESEGCRKRYKRQYTMQEKRDLINRKGKILDIISGGVASAATGQTG